MYEQAILNIAQRGMDSQWCLTIADHHGVEHQVRIAPRSSFCNPTLNICP